MSGKDDLKAFSELKGNTLLVYLSLVRDPGPIGVREVQRKLNFSSPTLAAYHLDKLESLGLISKTPQGYVLAREVKIAAVTQMVKFGSFLLPRFVFYTVFFSAVLVSYLAYVLLTSSMQLNVSTGFVVFLGFSIISVLVYETLRVWRQKPI